MSSNTREQILRVALELFSKNGYEATSMNDIAKPLNISKAALYKHFSGKQQIFDEIIEESANKYRSFSEGLALHLQPSEEAEAIDESDISVYGQVSVGQLSEKVIELVKFSMKDEYTKQVRHMLTIEQFRSWEFGKLYTSRYVDSMLLYDEKLFAAFMDLGIMKKDDPKQLALYFCAPVYMYMGIWDREPKREKECMDAIEAHVKHFFEMTHV